MFLSGTRLGLHEFPLQIDRDSGRPFSNRRSGWKDYLGRSIRRRLICADRGGSGRQALIEQEQSQKEFSTCQGNRGLAFRLFLLDIRRPLRATAGARRLVQRYLRRNRSCASARPHTPASQPGHGNAQKRQAGRFRNREDAKQPGGFAVEAIGEIKRTGTAAVTAIAEREVP